MTDQTNYVEQVAGEWAANDPLERWVNAAPDGPSPLEDTVAEYLGAHNPFPTTPWSTRSTVTATAGPGRGWSSGPRRMSGPSSSTTASGCGATITSCDPPTQWPE